MDKRGRLEKGSQKSQRQNFLKSQNECYLCGKAVNTHIEYLPKTHWVVERAQCHSCMTMIRIKNHSLQ